MLSGEIALRYDHYYYYYSAFLSTCGIEVKLRYCSSVFNPWPSQCVVSVCNALFSFVSNESVE